MVHGATEHVPVFYMVCSGVDVEQTVVDVQYRLRCLRRMGEREGGGMERVALPYVGWVVKVLDVKTYSSWCSCSVISIKRQNFYCESPLSPYCLPSHRSRSWWHQAGLLLARELPITLVVSVPSTSVH